MKKLSVLRDALTREMQSVWAAEGRVYEMGKKIEKVQGQLAAVQRELEAQRARAEAAEARANQADAADRHPAGIGDELAAVFRDAEEAVGQIVEESRRGGEEETAEITRLVAWHDQVAPHVEPLREAVAGAQQEIETLASLIREALEPINVALTDLGTRLDAFMQVAEEHSDEVVVDISDGDRSPTSPIGS